MTRRGGHGLHLGWDRRVHGRPAFQMCLARAVTGPERFKGVLAPSAPRSQPSGRGLSRADSNGRYAVGATSSHASPPPPPRPVSPRSPAGPRPAPARGPVPGDAIFPCVPDAPLIPAQPPSVAGLLHERDATARHGALPSLYARRGRGTHVPEEDDQGGQDHGVRHHTGPRPARAGGRAARAAGRARRGRRTGVRLRSGTGRARSARAGRAQPARTDLRPPRRRRRDRPARQRQVHAHAPRGRRRRHPGRLPGHPGPLGRPRPPPPPVRRLPSPRPARPLRGTAARGPRRRRRRRARLRHAGLGPYLARPGGPPARRRPAPADPRRRCRAGPRGPARAGPGVSAYAFLRHRRATRGLLRAVERGTLPEGCASATLLDRPAAGALRRIEFGGAHRPGGR